MADLAPVLGDLGVAVVETGTSANTAGTVVKRDGSGNFSAGTITANLTGTASAIADGSVTSGKLAASAISGQTSISSTETSDQLLILDATDTVLKRVTVGNLVVPPAGSIIQVQYAELTARTTAATDIPFDDTIPQNTEGNEILTVSITPSSASNTVLVTAHIPLVTISTTGRAIAALFVDSVADALAVSAQDLSTTSNIEETELTVCVRHSPATTSAVTYKLRVGPSTGTLYVLGVGSNAADRRFGGAARVTLIAQEIKG
jgi:hypothetical protein